MIVANGRRGSSIAVSIAMKNGSSVPDLSNDTGSIIGALQIKLEADVTDSQLTFQVSADWVAWVKATDKFVFSFDSDEELTIASISSTGLITVLARGTTPIAHKEGEFLYVKIFSDTNAGDLEMTALGIINFTVDVAESARIKDVMRCLLYRKASGLGEYICEPDEGFFDVVVNDVVAPLPS